MKWLIVILLLSAGVGLSYSVVSERKEKVQLLKEMENSLKRLAYYMCQWRMPVKEALEHVSKEEKGVLYEFYIKVWKTLTARQTEDFGKLWQEESRMLWCAEKIKELWSGAFTNIPMEPETLNRRLLLRAEEIGMHRAALEEKYKSEQRLVFTMGFFVSAFFCLILW